MQEELNQVERNQVWQLIHKSHDKLTTGTKWVFRNKLDESENIIRNKSRLVAQNYTQIEGINFEKIFRPVAQLEAIRFAFSSFKDFMLFQMDVKSTFLNGFIEEEVYVE